MGNPDDHGPARPVLRQDSVADRALVDADPEWAAYVAWADREASAGRVPEPEPWVLDDVEPWDLESRDLESWDLESWGSEPDGPGRADPVPAGPVPAGPAPAGPAPAGPVPAGPAPVSATRPLFAQDGAADVMPPSPFLAALTEQAVAGVAGLSDAELAGVLRASRRLVAREQYKQVLAAAEFGRRRRAAFQGALDRGVPAGCAAGGFPGEELAIELVTTRAEAGHLIDDAIDLTARLPRTLAAMAAGLVDAGRAGWIAFYTRSLTPAGTARADEVLAEAAPDLRTEQLAGKAAALEMKLNPEAVQARRERAKRDGQRVEARREASGNASLAGRELATADVLASKAYLDAVAARLREGGIEGSLDRLRALALTDLTQGRDPLDRIQPSPEAQPAPEPAPAPPAGPPAPPASPPGPRPAPPPGPSPDEPPQIAGPDGEDGRPSRPGGPPPVPALVNLIVPAGTLLGWSATPAQAGAWGLLDRDEARAIAAAAAAHPATRWCLTLTGPDGTALAHGCARGPRPRLLDDLEPQPPPGQPGQAIQAPQAAQAGQLAELLRRLNITLTPIARAPRDATTSEAGYVPSRRLKHLVRARTATCDAPGCQNPAVSTDLDHTVPWPDGPTSQSNLAPRCRTHHQAKQAPDWTVEQLAPGVTRWTLPSGRTHVTTPTSYGS
jgi:hypothetical protein